MKLNVVGVKGCVAVVKLVSALIGLAFSGAIGAVVGVVIGWAIEEIASEIGEQYMKKIESEEAEKESKKRNRYNGHKNSHKGFFESENWNVSKNLRGSKKRSFYFETHQSLVVSIDKLNFFHLFIKTSAFYLLILLFY